MPGGPLFWGSILLRSVRICGPFLGLGFGSGGPFWGFISVPVVRFGASVRCRWSVFGARFCSVVRFGASVWCRWSVFGARFWFRWSVLGLHFGSGGPFWGFGSVPVVRFWGFGAGDPFWGSVLFLVVRFGAPFWCRWSVLRLRFGAWWSVILGLDFAALGAYLWSVFGARFWFRWSVLGLHFGSGGPFWGFGSVPVVRFWGSVLFGGSFWGFGLVPVVRFWGSVLVPVVRFGASFRFRWSVLGLRFGAGGPFLGFWCR